MQCPFCAEQIQDAAIFCRFCGARKSGDTWAPPPLPPARPAARKGAFTIKTAGVCFLASGAASLFMLTSPIPFAGAMRNGAPVVAYNLLFALLFLGMGVGLLMGKVWGYNLVLIGTALYSIEKGLFLLNKSTRDAYLAANGMSRDVIQLVGGEVIDQYMILMYTALLASWWGFAIYLYWRRDYFQPSSNIPPATPRAS